MKEGVIFGLILAVIFGGFILAVRGVGTAIEREALQRAAAIEAQADLVVASAVSRQMDAATEAVRADTQAAHSPLPYIVPFVTLGAVLVVVIVGLALAVVWQQAQLRAIAAQLRNEAAQL
jgi:hypothetical protein